jgi:xanthine/uracil permease
MENNLISKNNSKSGSNPNKKRPWIITLLCFLGILWLFLMFLGIIRISAILKQNFNFNTLIQLIIEIMVFIIGIISLRLYWRMKRKAIYLLGFTSGFEIIFNSINGVWPLSLSCGCDFPIILTILGLLYIKQMD